MLLIFGNLAPVFADVLAHTFWEKEHLMTVHKSEGKYHVHFQIVNAEKRSAKDKSSTNNNSNSESVTHLIYCINYNFSNNYFICYRYSYHIFSLLISYSEVNYEPPRA